MTQNGAGGKFRKLIGTSVVSSFFSLFFFLFFLFHIVWKNNSDILRVGPVSHKFFILKTKSSLVPGYIAEGLWHPAALCASDNPSVLGESIVGGGGTREQAVPVAATLNHLVCMDLERQVILPVCPMLRVPDEKPPRHRGRSERARQCCGCTPGVGMQLRGTHWMQR